MTPAFLLDTNVVSDPLRPEPNPLIMRRLREHEGEAAISALVWHELRYGCARLASSARKLAVERYLEEVVLRSFPILDYDQRADWHAGERARLVAVGKTPPFIDGQIAAIAFVNDLTLISSNQGDFAGFEGLRVRSWS